MIDDQTADSTGRTGHEKVIVPHISLFGGGTAEDYEISSFDAYGLSCDAAHRTGYRRGRKISAKEVRYVSGVDVEIYTDGACSGNPGPGGWGALLKYGKHEKELYGAEPTTTTNNRMELMAPIRALESLKRPSTVAMYTDSTYVRNGIMQWLPKWKANGWMTSAKQPVKNVDLWQRLDEAVRPHQVEWFWVKGHAGHPENERADQLAVRGAQEAAG